MNTNQIKQSPLVSIITVTFNIIKEQRERQLIQCIESVHNQTYSQIEHIIIDGFSQDGSIKLFEKYKQLGWLNFFSEKDSGIYDAMNKGVFQAKGKYISFLNSDDFYTDRTAIERIVGELEKSDADYSFSPVVVIKSGKIIKNNPIINPKLSNIFSQMPFCHQTMFIKTSCIKRELFDSSFKIAGDYDLVLRLFLKKYKAKMIDFVFVTYRLSGKSEKNQKKSISECEFLFYKNYNNFCKLTSSECKNIYGNGYYGIPFKLALKLKKYQDFDYDEYLLSTEELRRQYFQINTQITSLKEELQNIHASKAWYVVKHFKQLFRKLFPTR